MVGLLDAEKSKYVSALTNLARDLVPRASWNISLLTFPLLTFPRHFLCEVRPPAPDSEVLLPSTLEHSSGHLTAVLPLDTPHTPGNTPLGEACLLALSQSLLPSGFAESRHSLGFLRVSGHLKGATGFLPLLVVPPQVEHHLQVEEVRLRPAVGRGRRPLPVTEGLVEVRLPDGWAKVCDKGWSAHNSHVVCGMLGFPSEKRVNTAFYR